MTVKRKDQNLCKTPLIVGRSYLDTWGEWRSILGYAYASWLNTKRNPDVVYCQCCHYDIKTGIATDPSVRLVNLPPAEEIEYFEGRIKQIERVNSEDKLKLVAEGLDNMRCRIKELKKHNTT